MTNEIILLTGKAADVAERINEGVWEARAKRLANENNELRQRIAMLEAKIALYCWGMDREHEMRLAAECEIDRKKRALWRRAMRTLGINV